MGQYRQRRFAHPTTKRVKFRALIDDLFCGDDQRAEIAAISLAKHGQSALRVLRPYVDSNEVDQRWWVLRALVEISDKRVNRFLINALHDAELSVRQCAALGLCKQPSAAAVTDLIEALADENALLRRLAAEALIATGDASVEPLIEVMENGPQLSRMEAARALAIIGDPRAIPVLYAAQSEDSTILNYWASEGLDRIGVGMVYFYP
jgi:HEAT repeat protein